MGVFLVSDSSRRNRFKNKRTRTYSDKLYLMLFIGTFDVEFSVGMAILLTFDCFFILARFFKTHFLPFFRRSRKKLDFSVDKLPWN